MTNMLSETLALAASTGDVTHADEYDGIIGWVLDLITRFGEVGVGLALAIESVFPRSPPS
nr:hypothetical protein GCM10025732_06730 [Glycomyces mayteni]